MPVRSTPVRPTTLAQQAYYSANAVSGIRFGRASALRARIHRAVTPYREQKDIVPLPGAPGAGVLVWKPATGQGATNAVVAFGIDPANPFTLGVE
jgi:hypothetical protein